MLGRPARPPFALLSAAASFLAWSAAHPGTASAYTVASAVSTGCHERITAEALREVRLELPTAAPLGADENERALIDDVEFPLPDDMRDLGATAMLLGVRDNDLKGRQSNDVSELALVHGNPNLQREHCLRSSDDDEPDGSQTAVTHCREFILERVGQALDGLDDAGAPDPANRTSLSVYLALRHRVDAPLPTFYLRMGQALHAVEDSFTHTYRSPDGMQIDVVLNWVDGVNGGLVPARDGPAHAGELDHCDDADDLRQQRRLLATDAATALLRATLDPKLGPGAKDGRGLGRSRPVPDVRARLQLRQRLVQRPRTQVRRRRAELPGSRELLLRRAERLRLLVSCCCGSVRPPPTGQCRRHRRPAGHPGDRWPCRRASPARRECGRPRRGAAPGSPGTAGGSSIAWPGAATSAPPGR